MNQKPSQTLFKKNECLRNGKFCIAKINKATPLHALLEGCAGGGRHGSSLHITLGKGDVQNDGTCAARCEKYLPNLLGGITLKKCNDDNANGGSVLVVVEGTFHISVKWTCDVIENNKTKQSQCKGFIGSSWDTSGEKVEQQVVAGGKNKNLVKSEYNDLVSKYGKLREGLYGVLKDENEGNDGVSKEVVLKELSEMVSMADRTAMEDGGLFAVVDKCDSDKGEAKLLPEYNHIGQHVKGDARLVDKVLQLKGAVKCTVIAEERDQHGSPLGMADVALMAKVLKYNTANEVKTQIKVPQELTTSPIYADAELYNIAAEKGIKVLGIDRDPLSQTADVLREKSMSDKICNLMKMGYDVTYIVGAAHYDKLEYRVHHCVNSPGHKDYGTHKLFITNNSGETQKVAIFQKSSIKDSMPLVWMFKELMNGESHNFEWDVEWGLGWARGAEKLAHGVSFTSYSPVIQVNPEPASALGNSVAIGFDKTSDKGDFTIGISNDNSLHNGELKISTSDEFSAKDAQNMSVLVYMDGKAAFAMHGKPNGNYVIHTNTEYYVAVTDNKEGDAVSFQYLSDGVKVDFKDNMAEYMVDDHLHITSMGHTSTDNNGYVQHIDL